MEVNAEPLQTTSVRMGEGGAPELFVVHRLTRKSGKIGAASVHRPGCGKAPAGQRRDGSTWSASQPVSRGESYKAVNEVETEHGIEVGIWCSACGGWRLTL